MTPQVFRLFLIAIEEAEEFKDDTDCKLSIIKQIYFWGHHDLPHCLDIIANHGHMLTIKELLLLTTGL